MKTMQRVLGVGVVAAAVGTLAFLGSQTQSTAVAEAAPAPAPAPSGDFTIDPVHSNIIFGIKHLNATNFHGRLNDFSGSFTLGDTASIDVTVKAESVDTNQPKRDAHIKSPDFFSAKEFPTITFKAKDLKHAGEGAWSGKGDLTFRGVTKPIDLTLTMTGEGKGQGGKQIVGLESKITIKRSDFGNNFMVGPLSDEVTLLVNFEGNIK